MSGLFAYVGEGEAVSHILEGLQILDYRGYDSAGIASIHEGRLNLRKEVGTVQHLRSYIERSPLYGHIGIGHTRWASHGAPTKRNAHPVRYKNVCVVHNGIVENSEELHTSLEKEGFQFSTETDTEVIACLLYTFYKATGSLLESGLQCMEKLQGSMAFLALIEEEEDTILALCSGTPLAIGLGENEFMLASDITAFVRHCNDAIVMQEGSLGLLSPQGVRLYSLADGSPMHIEKKRINFGDTDIEKGGYKKFMLKEIFEQPRAIRKTLGKYLPVSHSHEEVTSLLNAPVIQRKFTEMNRIVLLASGSAGNSGRVGKEIYSHLLGISVQFALASEARFSPVSVDEKTLVIALSQSGETADTLIAAERHQKEGAFLLSITNSEENALSRLADFSCVTEAGPELSVSSTKTFSASVALHYALALHMASVRKNIQESERHSLTEKLLHLPELTEKTLEQEEWIEEVTAELKEETAFVFLGRGINYPVILEAAMKAQEVAYLHAFAFATGELKHGHIAMMNEGFPVIALLPDGELYEKGVIDMQELHSRGFKIVVITNRPGAKLKALCYKLIEIPACDEFLSPLLFTTVLQLFAYFSGMYRKCPIDKPRNIAKSLTV